MTETPARRWEDMRTDETRSIEKALLDAGLQTVDAYRYNSASIRIRVIDPKFEGLPPEKRDAMVEPYLDRLPANTQADIVSLFTFAPSELEQTSRQSLLNREFDDPSPSVL